MATQPLPGGSSRRPRRVGDCPCGGGQDGFFYRRGVLSGFLSKGFWYCGDCGGRVHPNPGQGILTAEDKDRLRRLRELHSNDGWGDLFIHESVLACAWPLDTEYAVPLQ